MNREELAALDPKALAKAIEELVTAPDTPPDDAAQAPASEEK